MESPVAFVVVAAILGAIAWLWLRSPGVNPETELRRICQGDEEQAQRLIDGEMVRTPGISRAEAAARAVARYRRDNR